MMPHSPHNPPERLLDEVHATRRKSIHVARYWAMCEWFDETVGELLAKLEKNGQAKDTLVIYLHDNGWIQDPDSPNFAPKSKRSPYDGGLRTPVIIKWPGQVKPGIERAARELHRPRPDHPGGGWRRSRRPTCRASTSSTRSASPAATAIFGEVFEHNAVDIHKPAANLQYRWVIEGNWKLIVPHEPNVKGGRPELYDLAKDPTETENLALKHPDRVKPLKRKVDGWWRP